MSNKYTQEQIDEFRAQWLAQLRSSEAKKHVRWLEDAEDSDKRCCLGHACHALGIDRHINVINQMVAYGDNAFSLMNTKVLPSEAQAKLNINESGEFVHTIRLNGKGILFQSLSHLNDRSGLEPHEIADIIEENFKSNNFRQSVFR